MRDQVPFWPRSYSGSKCVGTEKHALGWRRTTRRFASRDGIQKGKAVARMSSWRTPPLNDIIDRSYFLGICWEEKKAFFQEAQKSKSK